MAGKLLYFCFGILLFLSGVLEAQAGFGISPPYVKNNHLIPGSTYEQEIMLLRSTAEKDMQAIASIDAPEIASWVSINEGTKFILPKDELRTPIKITVKVPPNAPIGSYKGYINIKVTPADNQGGVAVALGVRVDIDLTVTNETVDDFVVRNVVVKDFEELGWPWNGWPLKNFFYKSKVLLTIENVGNTEIAPTKVLMEVLDITQQELLESSYDNALKKVPPFSTAEVSASFATGLVKGQYFGRVKVYKGDTVINSYSQAFNVAAQGELGLDPLGPWPWILSIAALIVCFVLIFIFVKFRSWRFILLLFYMFFSLFKPFFRWLGDSFQNMRRGFWRWAYRKAREFEQRNR